jgi:hypothetical protein
MLFSGSGGKGIVISVQTPDMKNTNATNDFMPDLFQDSIIHYMNTFSAMTVLDSRNEAAVVAEQRKTESGAYADIDTDIFGNLTTPDHVVVGTISLIGSQYNLTFRINDVKTNEVKASCNERCAIGEIQNGSASRIIARGLLTQMGITLTAEGERQLIKTDEKRVQAQVQVARGAAASRAGNDVAALAFYAEAMNIDPAFSLAKERLEHFSIEIPASAIRERANAAIILADRWNNIFRDLRAYVEANPIIVEADLGNIEETKINTNKRTIDLKISPGMRIMPNRTTFMVLLTVLQNFDSYATKDENKAWTSNVRVSVRGGSINWRIYARISLYNEYGDCVAAKNIYIGELVYSAYEYPRFILRSPGGIVVHSYDLRRGIPSINKMRNEIPVSLLTFTDIPLNDITDVMIPKIEAILNYPIGHSVGDEISVPILPLNGE